MEQTKRSDYRIQIQDREYDLEKPIYDLLLLTSMERDKYQRKVTALKVIALIILIVQLIIFFTGMYFLFTAKLFPLGVQFAAGMTAGIGFTSLTYELTRNLNKKHGT